jgi:deoxyuridine 5'-triphosphate nucleotidohydrolase
MHAWHSGDPFPVNMVARTTFEVERTSPAASLPARQTWNSAGFDVSACLIDVKEDGTELPRDIQMRSENGGPYNWPARCAHGQWSVAIHPGHRALIPLGFKASLPDQVYAQLHLRSSAAWKRGLILGNNTGIIDGDYPDEWLLMVKNTNPVKHFIEIIHGERIAQAVLHKYEVPFMYETTVGITTNRTGGLGSTG